MASSYRRARGGSPGVRRRRRKSSACVAALMCGTSGVALVSIGLVGIGASPASAAAACAPGATSSSVSRTACTTTTDDVTATITRAGIIARAASWVTQKVPYSQVSWWTDANGTYRQDCSGYVAMAWALNQRVNYWTGNLATVSHRIPSYALQPGDILLKAYDHTVIFAGWTNAEQTRFNLYEQYRRGYPARQVYGAPLSYYLNRGYGAYRYNGLAQKVTLHDGTPPTALREQSASTLGEISLVAHATSEPAGVPWTEEPYDAETSAPSGRPDAVTPPAVENLPVEVLTAAQRAMDDTVPLALGPVPLPSGRADLVLAGCCLIFLAAPLTVAARAGAWSPAPTAGPV